MNQFLRNWVQKWIRLFITLYQQALLDQTNRKKSRRKEEVIGTAILRRDNFTGKKFWVSWDGEGHNEVTFSAGQPLVFPPDPMQAGTRVQFLPPEKWDD